MNNTEYDEKDSLEEDEKKEELVFDDDSIPSSDYEDDEDFDF